jgi:small GTP-binding protein
MSAGALDAKIVLLGAANVGKTCILYRATNNDFDEQTSNTIGACYSPKPVEVDGTTINLQVWDTAGQEKFRTLAPMYYRGSIVALLVFSVIDAASLNEVRNWAEEMKGEVDEMPVLFVVGNKTDLLERKVEVSEGEGLANELKATYCEVSAKTGVGVDELFFRVAELALKKLQGRGEEVNQPKVKVDQPVDAQKKKGWC